MASTPKQPIDALSLLAFKTASDVFDLSSGLSYVSIRDQIVRARILARDIAVGFPARKEILVVGAGIAGVSFACAAASLGRKVLVVDTRDAPVALQAQASHRYIGPHMYEWPAGIHVDQNYPSTNEELWELSDDDCPKWGDKDPIRGDSFVGQVRVWLAEWLKDRADKKSDVPVFVMKVDEEAITKYVGDFVKETKEKGCEDAHKVSLSVQGVSWTSSGDAAPESKHIDPFQPEFIVLAGGMGVETTKLKVGLKELEGCKGFWEHEDKAALEEAVAVFGAGDGAIQDVLLCVTTCEHPLLFLQQLRNNSCDAAQSQLSDAESQLRDIAAQYKLEASWTIGMKTDWIDERCAALADAVAEKGLTAIQGLIRKRTAPFTLVTREKHIGPCYLLNRFVFHLVRAYFDNNKGQPPLFQWRKGVEVESADKPDGKPYEIKLNDGKADLYVQRIFVRWGVSKNPNATPGYKLIGITDEYRATRTSLSQLPLPFVLPHTSSKSHPATVTLNPSLN